MTATFEDVVRAARMLIEQPLSFSVDSFIKVVEEWLESLPENLKDSYVGFFSPSGAKAVRRRDLPRVLREDPEFRERFVRMLAGR